MRALQRKVLRLAVGVPVAEVNGEGSLVVNVAELGVLDGAVVPDKVFPVDLGQAFLRLGEGEDAVVAGEVGAGGLVAPPALAVGVAHGRVGLGGVVFLRQQVVGNQHVLGVGGLADDHSLPAIVLVELHDGAVAVRVGHHIVVARAHGGVVADVHGFQQVQRFLDGGAAVQPQAHDDGRAHVGPLGVLLGGLLREGHDGGAEALLIHPVHGRVDRGEAAQGGEEGVRKFLQGVTEVGHVADGDGGVALLRAGDGHHSRVLEIVVVAAEPEAVALGFRGLEAGAVEGCQLAVLVGHLGALDLQGEALADAADHIVQQFGVRVHVLGDEVVQVVGGLVLHLVQVRVPVDGLDGGDSADFSAPNAEDDEDEGEEDPQDPEKDFFHGQRVYHPKIAKNA